jgi:2,5-diketo-D-gluconate reductase A
MNDMRQTLRLNADTDMPYVGFGTYLVPADQTLEAVRTAISLGYRHIDTAEFYHSEEAVGEGIRAGMHRLDRGDGLAWSVGDPTRAR